MNTLMSVHLQRAASVQVNNMLINTIELCQQTLNQVNSRQSMLQETSAPFFNLQSAMAASFIPHFITTQMAETALSTNRLVQNDSYRIKPLYSVKSFCVPASSISDTDMISPEIRHILSQFNTAYFSYVTDENLLSTHMSIANTSKGSDSLGLDIVWHEGQLLCNNFNWDLNGSDFKPLCSFHVQSIVLV
ncbi:unnamed protein product [Mytilus edulis]|uniref:Uncharacterized protein n=1 Tax=Mytilus edulis TaxID=6550 RepID=A0A8S3UAR2_MYTED|nr:unnamed protein product [Mytilus edulis]